MQRIQYTIYGLLLALILSACGGSTATPTPTPTAIPPTLVPTSTVTPYPTDTTIPAAVGVPPSPIATLTPAQILLAVEEGQAIEPPIQITLPDSWERNYFVHLYEDVDGEFRLIPVATYYGPVTGGNGFIILLWAFENVVDPYTLTTNLHSDGLRLLRFVVIEPGCVIGTDVERGFTVGGLPATGTYFSAVGCEETVDTRGWFAVLQQERMNFAFYMYTEPLEAMNGIAMAEIEDILDTVTFQVAEMLTATPPAGQ